MSPRMKLGVAGVIALLVILFFGGIIFAAASERVSAGTVCVVTRNGADVDLAEPGRVWLTPAIEGLECYETSVRNLEFTGNEDASKASYTDTVITQKSKDGVDINFAAQLYFSIPDENVREIYRTRGRSMNALVEKHIQVITRDVSRDVIEQAPVDDIYLGGMEKYSEMIEKQLAERLADIGVDLESFDLTAIDPSDEYKQAIEQQKEQEQIASLEAEKVEVEKQKAEQKRVAAQGDADAGIIRAEGTAKENEIITESVTDEILALEYYEALKTINWAILESADGAQPMLPVATPAAEPQE